MTQATDQSPGIAGLLRTNARSFPDKKAIIFASGAGTDGIPEYRHQTYLELDRKSDEYAAGMHRIGITPGTKTVLMLEPGAEFFAVLFGLIKAGAVPVLVDPGMGVRRMLHCYRSTGAEAFIGVPAAHVVRVLSPRAFSSLRTHVTAGRRWFWGGHSLRELAVPGVRPPAVPCKDDDLLLIGFTTGSTGPAKGVETTHGMAAAMVRQLARSHGQTSDDVSMLTSPMFGFLDLLAGITCVLPPVDPAKVAGADPHALLDAMQRFGVTTMFASPALLSTFGPYALEAGARLPAVRRMVSGGAPVTEGTVTTLHELLGGGEHERFHATYGATEVLPISTISSTEIVTETAELTRAGQGVCVGRPVDSVQARIIRVTDEQVPVWSDALAVARGEVGEIVVSGPTVSTRYHGSDIDPHWGKIHEGQRVWHRTGDLGRVDAEGRIWFCGRKSQRVRTADGPMYTVQCEQIFNAHPDVHRTALVGVGARGEHQEPVLCVELHEGVTEHARIERELAETARQHPLTQGLRTFLFHPEFPVDIRHNAKIGREELADWAAAELGIRGSKRSRRTLALRAVPLAGWFFLLYGLVHPFSHPALRTLFWIDAFLSIVVHGLQVPSALRRARKAGHGTTRTVLLTFLLGATWWKDPGSRPPGSRPLGSRRSTRRDEGGVG